MENGNGTPAANGNGHANGHVEPLGQFSTELLMEELVCVIRPLLDTLDVHVG